MRAVIVAVDYQDILSLTLAYNRHHFSSVTVITASHCAELVIPIAQVHRADVIVTDLFYANGARFNKWAALEYGLDRIGREGWICLLDADVLWPQDASFLNPRFLIPGCLYTPRRRMWLSYPHCPLPIRYTDRMLGDVRIPGEEHWGEFPLHPQEREFAGYSQIFHASDPVLGPPPWHQVNWKHAGGADSFFQAKWSEDKKIRPPFEVLHLGEAGKNWCGRATPYTDGTVPLDGEVRRRATRQFILDRRLYGNGEARFDGERF